MAGIGLSEDVRWYASNELVSEMLLQVRLHLKVKSELHDKIRMHFLGYNWVNLQTVTPVARREFRDAVVVVLDQVKEQGPDNYGWTHEFYGAFVNHVSKLPDLFDKVGYDEPES